MKRSRAVTPRAEPAEPSTSRWAAFYAVVRQVPPGQVTTYGEVARAAGFPGHARQVGYALAALRGSPIDDVPWHRVVNAKGEVSARARSAGEAEANQRLRLEAEGVRFEVSGRVDLRRFGWHEGERGSGDEVAPPADWPRKGLRL